MIISSFFYKFFSKTHQQSSMAYFTKLIKMNLGMMAA